MGLGLGVGFVVQSKNGRLIDSGAWGSFRRAMLVHDATEQCDVGGKGLATGIREGEGRQGSAAPIGFRDCQVTGLLQRPGVGGDVAVGHTQHVSEFREGNLRGGGQHGHDGEATLFVDHAIELLIGLEVHDGHGQGRVWWR